MINSMAYLRFGHPQAEVSSVSHGLWGSWLRAGYNYTRYVVPLNNNRGLIDRRNRYSFQCLDPNRLDDTFVARARRVNGFKRPTLFRRLLLKAADNRQREPVLRAATLLHEAVHYEEGNHDGGVGCLAASGGLNGVCDQTFYSHKPYAVDTRWLEQFGHCATASSDAMRNRAINVANTRLRRRFTEDPKYVIPTLATGPSDGDFCEGSDGPNRRFTQPTDPGQPPRRAPTRQETRTRKWIPDEERGPNSAIAGRVRHHVR